MVWWWIKGLDPTNLNSSIHWTLALHQLQLQKPLYQMFPSWHLPNKSTCTKSDWETNFPSAAKTQQHTFCLNKCRREWFLWWILYLLSFIFQICQKVCLSVCPICLYDKQTLGCATRLTLPTCSLARLQTQSLSLLNQSEPSAIRNPRVQLAGRLVTEINGTDPTLTGCDWCVQINYRYWILVDMGSQK